MNISITGQEEINVPAGVLNTWHLVMSFSSAKHDAWYAVEPPYLLVQYRNQGSGVEFRLRSWQLGEGQPVQGNQQSAVVPEPQPATTEMPPVNWLLLGLIGFIQLPLMLGFPIGLGWWLRHRFSQSWRLFFAGAVVFMASQLVHLPLNWALGLLGGSRGVALLPLPLVALIAGLSAGVCEEGARWLALRFYLRKDRGWKPALQIGAGHGGIEAILLAGLAFWGLVNILLVQSVGVEALGLTGNAAAQALGTVKAYWSVAWYLPVFAGLERLFAISAHIFMTVLVMRSFTRRNPGYLLAAIGFHTLLDAWAVWGSQMFHTGWVELGVGVLALFSLWMVLKLRDADEHEPAGKAEAVQ